MSAASVIEAVQAWQPELAAIRRDIHAHPELGMEEVRTSALVARYLEGLGIEVATGIGRLGVVATIRGSLPGQRVIGLRADMDALPIEEATGKPWASTTPGLMHACGHGGSAPHLATDVTVVQAHFVLALQTIIGRNVPAVDSAVLSVGAIAGGSLKASNVMPATLTVTGTSRSYTPGVRDLLERRIGELANGLAAMHGCTAEYTYRRGVPPTVNHPEQTEVAMAAAADLVAEGLLDRNMTPVMGAEDFGLMLEKRPGAFMFLGGGTGPGGVSPNVHTPLFDFNDDIIPMGVAYWASVVAQELGGQRR